MARRGSEGGEREGFVELRDSGALFLRIAFFTTTLFSGFADIRHRISEGNTFRCVGSIRLKSKKRVKIVLESGTVFEVGIYITSFSFLDTETTRWLFYYQLCTTSNQPSPHFLLKFLQSGLFVQGRYLQFVHPRCDFCRYVLGLRDSPSLDPTSMMKFKLCLAAAFEMSRPTRSC